MYSRTRKSLVGAFLVAAVAAVGATPAGAAKGGTDRPFLSSATGTNTFQDFQAGECGPPTGSGSDLSFVCDQSIELDFIGTHLGRSTYTSTGTITFFVFQGCSTPSVPAGIRFASSQVASIVAANGDTLTAQVNTTGCGDGVNPAEPSGTFNIVGGTGRFAEATGSGILNGVALGSSLSNEWVGTISY